MSKRAIFKFSLLIIAMSVAFLCLFKNAVSENKINVDPQHQTLYVFYDPDCNHCRDALAFLKKQSLNNIQIKYVDVTTASGKQLLLYIKDLYNINFDNLGVPLFILGGNYRIGFDSEETTGKELLTWLKSSNNK